MTNIVIKPPQATHRIGMHRIFLGGSIEMGKAEDWQTRVVEMMSDIPDLIFMNPRRDDWDPTWTQEMSNPKFNEQVMWELNNLNFADHIIMYLQPGTLSPISLLELGLHATSNKMLVCCPDGFWRKGNVEIVCRENYIPLYDNIEDLVKQLKWLIGFKRQGEFE